MKGGSKSQRQWLWMFPCPSKVLGNPNVAWKQKPWKAEAMELLVVS